MENAKCLNENHQQDPFLSIAWHLKGTHQYTREKKHTQNVDDGFRFEFRYQRQWNDYYYPRNRRFNARGSFII